MNQQGGQVEISAAITAPHPAVAGLDKEQVKQVARLLVDGEALPMLQTSCAKQFNFKKRTIALRMRLVEYGDGWARYEDSATSYGRVVLDMETQTSTLDEYSWDKGLMAAFRKQPEKRDEDSIREGQAVIDRTSSGAWFKRKLWALEASYRRIAAVRQEGVSTRDLVPSVTRLLHDDRLAFEEKEFIASCGGMTIDAWAEAIALSLMAKMSEVQDAEFRQHAMYMEGLALAEEALCDTNSVWRAAAKVKLKAWAAEIDASRFVADASALELVMEEARQLAG